MMDQVVNEIEGMAVIMQNVLNNTRANEEDYQAMLRENAHIDAMFRQRTQDGGAGPRD